MTTGSVLESCRSRTRPESVESSNGSFSRDASSRLSQVNLGERERDVPGGLCCPVLSTGTVACGHSPASALPAAGSLPATKPGPASPGAETEDSRAQTWTGPKGPSFLPPPPATIPGQGLGWRGSLGSWTGLCGDSLLQRARPPPRLTTAQGRRGPGGPSLAGEPSVKTSWRRCSLSSPLEGCARPRGGCKVPGGGDRQKLGRTRAGESAVGEDGGQRLGELGQAPGPEMCLRLASWESAVASHLGPRP